MTLTQSSPLTILLDRHAHNYAQQFASQQATPQKGKQVYLNTLAVYAVNTYLKCFPIATNLAQSDCWHPGIRAIFNVADLVLPNFGKIECLAVLPEAETITIPAEVREDRLGYIVVQFEEKLQQVDLLGFISSKDINFATETFNINQLQPLERLFDTLDTLQQQVNLRQWLTGFFPPDWQPVNIIMAGRIARSLSNTDTAVTTISRGKAIAWQVNNTEENIVLVLKITESSSNTIDLCLQLYPDRESNNLPIGLSVKILDEAGETCLSATAKDSDDWIQLEFACQQGEVFKVEMNLAGVTIVEKFAV
ncbi:MAG: DUF1822 family protein [Xenococcaceae cyanobacterium MO_167.B27]|nr:DUF1822 family protein [Xenococcaceae cyanobacterium MO_167.B27]